MSPDQYDELMAVLADVANQLAQYQAATGRLHRLVVSYRNGIANMDMPMLPFERNDNAQYSNSECDAGDAEAIKVN